MNVEAIYPVNDCRVVLNWHDATQQYDARIETDSPEPAVLWQYQPPENDEYDALLGMLALTQIKVQELTGLEKFEVSEYDLHQLRGAPTAIQIDPATLPPRIETLDTDYLANFAQYEAAIDDAWPEQEDMEQEVSDSMALLQECVEILLQLQRIENGEEADLQHHHGTVDSRRANVIAITAQELTTTNYELTTMIRTEPRLIGGAIAAREEPWDINDLFNTREIALINTCTYSLCGSWLTDFPKSIARGFSPLTGLPLQCPNPEIFSWRSSIPDNSEALYRRLGLSDYAARRIVDIQRTDPRYRQEEDWEFLEATRQQLISTSSVSNARQVDPSEIIHLDILDTEYTNNLHRYTDMFGELMRPENLEEENSNSMSHLQSCVELLKVLGRIESGQEEDLPHSYGTIEMRQQGAIAHAAAQLVQSSYELATMMSNEPLSRLEAATFDAHELWDIHALFNDREISLINTFTYSLCGSNLTDFPLALERGYDPTSGLPLDCPNPETFRWEDTVGSNTAELYQQNGLSAEDAALMIQIQRTDPRYRNEAAWVFMMEATERLMTVIQYLKEEPEIS